MTSAQKPSVGRIVLIGVDPTRYNGADVAPAVITRVWNDSLVNLRIIGDTGETPEWKTSVYLFEDQAAAEAHTAGPFAKAYWPPRV